MHSVAGVAGRTRSRTTTLSSAPKFSCSKNDVVSLCSDDDDDDDRPQKHRHSASNAVVQDEDVEERDDVEGGRRSDGKRRRKRSIEIAGRTRAVKALTRKHSYSQSDVVSRRSDNDDDPRQQHKHSGSDAMERYVVLDSDECKNKDEEDDDDDVVSLRSADDRAEQRKHSDSDAVEDFTVPEEEEEEEEEERDEEVVEEEAEEKDEEVIEEEENVVVVDRGSEGKGKRDRSVESGVKRRKAYGLDVLIDHNTSNEKKSAAQRTRSHFRRSKKFKIGTLSQPIFLDEEDKSLSESSVPDSDEAETREASESSDEEEDSSSEGYESEEEVQRNRKPYRKRQVRDSDDLPMKFSFSGEEQTPEKTEYDEDLDKIWLEMDSYLDATQCDSSPASEVGLVEEKSSDKKRRVHGVENFDSFDNLQDSVFDKIEADANVDLSPLKFSFGKEKPKTEEKSEGEEEQDALWAEMEYYLHATPPDSVPSSQVQNDADSDHDECSKGEVSTATLCGRGKHHLILDEEIGLVCAYCLHVNLEIKYYVPPFDENRWRKSNRRDSFSLDDMEQSVFDKLRHQAAGYDDHSLCNHSGTVWDIIPGVKQTLYPHQQDAFEFLWNNMAGGIFLDKLKERKEFPDAGGCIISHTPGSGKSLLTIVFLRTFVELFPSCRPIIIAPRGILLSWEEEFKTWKVDIPFHNLNNLNLIQKSGPTVLRRAVKLHRTTKLDSWKRNKSILGISYKLFEQLTKQRTKDKVSRDALIENTGLLVLDEGHTPRNSESLLFKAVSRMRTKRRIILSGTPFQNNFDELYNTLCVARPEFAEWNPSGDKPGHPKYESKGKWMYLTNSFSKATDDIRRIKILREIRNMIRPFVHVYKGTTMHHNLPGLMKFLVILRPTQLQKEIFEDIQKARKNQSQFVFKLEYEESVTAVHPALFGLSEGKKPRRFKSNPDEGVKTKFLMELIRLSVLRNEKVLVFSQHIKPLKLVASQLKKHFGWHEGGDVLQMHGKDDAKMRQTSIKAFNDPNSKVKVMLASTRACCEGISLVGASRVVLLDVVWNPSVERQAISRAYRPGQKKFVYTYHLITEGTRDEEKFCRQAEKDQISESVFFDSDEARQFRTLSHSELEDRIMESMVQQEKFAHIFEKIAINY